MKKLIILILSILLTSCVSYYYPETALEDGVYYAEDDPSYVLNSGDYSGVVYYPWSSLDYFYMGYWPYHGYGYPFGWAYSPWGYPYAYQAYYSPWYASYHHRPYWPTYRRHARHAGINNVTPDNDNSSVRRYISTAPAGQSAHQGMVIRNNQSRKPGKSRVGPTQPSPSKSVIIAPATSNTAMRPTAAPATGTFSGRSNRSRPVSSPSSQSSSMKSGSSRPRDRD